MTVQTNLSSGSDQRPFSFLCSPPGLRLWEGCGTKAVAKGTTLELVVTLGPSAGPATLPFKIQKWALAQAHGGCHRPWDRTGLKVKDSWAHPPEVLTQRPWDPLICPLCGYCGVMGYAVWDPQSA